MPSSSSEIDDDDDDLSFELMKVYFWLLNISRHEITAEATFLSQWARLHESSRTSIGVLFLSFFLLFSSSLRSRQEKTSQASSLLSFSQTNTYSFFFSRFFSHSVECVGFFPFDFLLCCSPVLTQTMRRTASPICFSLFLSFIEYFWYK